jgi:two-component sensor histidine kinase
LVPILFCTSSPLSFAQSQPKTKERRLEELSSKTRADTNRVNILLNAASLLVNKSGRQPYDLSKAGYYANEGLGLSRKLNFIDGEGSGYIAISEVLRAKKDTVMGMKYAELAINFANAHSLVTQQINSHLEMAHYFNWDGNGLKPKIDHESAAVNLLKKHYPGTLRLADALQDLGALHNVLQPLRPEALNELYEALSIYKANHYQQVQLIYNRLADVYLCMDNYREGLRYGLLAIKTVEQFKDSSETACSAYYHVGSYYYMINDAKNAEIMLKKGLAIAHKTKNTGEIFDITNSLSCVTTLANHPAESIPDLKYALTLWSPQIDLPKKALMLSGLMAAYTFNKQYNKAQQYYLPLKKVMSEIHAENNTGVENGRRAIVDLFFGTHRYSEIPVLLEASRAQFARQKSVTGQMYYESTYFKLDSSNQRYVSAIAHYQKFKALSDSVNKRRQDKQLSVLEVQYETEKKDQEIGSLMHQTLLQQTSLKNQRLARNLLFGSVALLIVMLGSIYSRYRIKQQANEELSEQKEEIDAQNDSLKQLLTEREWLMKEVHHRVKNNLQIVISLLNSQSAYLKDPAMLEVLNKSQHRMRSISMIHQKLYQGDDLSGIDMHGYIHELVNYLEDSFDTHGKIGFLLGIDKVTMDVSQAVPIGLILNEAITNSIKYAFKDKDGAQIQVMLKIHNGNQFKLRIADNGQGLPEGFYNDKRSSLGMTLMKGLSRQLGGPLELQNKNGLCIQLTGRKAAILSNSSAIESLAQPTHQL